MEISQVEYQFLIECSTREQPVQVAFGGGHARLKDLPANEWAIELVEAARAAVAKRAMLEDKGGQRCPKLT